MLLISLLIQLLLLLNIQFTVWPEFILFPYLVNNGLKPYSEVIDQHTPGFVLSPVNFASFNIDSIGEFKLIFIFISLTQTLLLYKFSKDFLNNGIEKYVVILHAVIQPLFTTGKIWYESFVTLFLSFCLFFLSRNNFFISGLSAGIMTLWKQTGVFLVIPIYLYLVKYNKQSGKKFIIGYIFPLVVWAVYLHKNNLVGDFFTWAIKFNFIYPSMAHLSVPKSVLLLLVFISFPLLINSLRKFEFKLAIFTGLYLFSFIGVFVRFDYFHLQIITPGLVIIIGMFLKYQSTFVKISYLFLILFFIGKLSWVIPPSSVTNSYFDHTTMKVSNWIKSHTSPKEEIFLLGAQPHIYKLSDTLPPGKYFTYHLPWYMKFLEDKQLSILEANSPKFIVIDSTAEVDGININKYAEKLVTHVLKNYVAVEYIDNYTVYEKNH